MSICTPHRTERQLCLACEQDHNDQLRREVATLRALLGRLLKFAEYLGDTLNEMDAVEDEDLEAEGGILEAARLALTPQDPPPTTEGA